MSRDDGDRPRFLHRDAAHNYADSSFLGARDEPEALTANEQRAQTLRAQRRWEAEQARAWGTARQRIDGALAAFETFVRDRDRQLLSDLRVLRRQAERIDHRLGL